MKHFFASAAMVTAATAQSTVGAWGQCGGQGWTGGTVCASGYHCQVSNPYYSQCLPGAGSSAPASTPKTTTKLPGPTITTSIKTTAKPVTSVTSKTSAASTPAASGSIPSASGTSFIIDGEKTFFAGTNSYWIGFLNNNDDIDLVMQHLSEAGLKVLRVWGFNDVTSLPGGDTVYYQSFINGEATINTGANGLQRLDYVVKSAEAHGIKLIVNFVNNWTDYGGMAAYFNYAGITSNAQWYASTKAQTQYQKYVKAVVSRYSNSPAIFAWELANEPRCNGCDVSVITDWARVTSNYIKFLDSKHMVTTGEEGFGLPGDGSYPYQYGEGGNFTDTCALPNIDFCTYHLYPESWSVTPAQEWGNAWIKAHAKVCQQLNKPCVLEEFGKSNTCSIELSWQMTALETAGTAGSMFWQLGDTLSYGKTHQDGNTVYYKDDLWQCLVAPFVEAINEQ